jgi:hypothetical protein
MQAGRLKEAHALAEHTLGLTRAYRERGRQAYALHLLGDIAARREPPEIALAETFYQQALTLAEALGMRPLQATAIMVSAPYMPWQDKRYRPVPSCLLPSHYTVPWT